MDGTRYYIVTNQSFARVNAPESGQHSGWSPVDNVVLTPTFPDYLAEGDVVIHDGVWLCLRDGTYDASDITEESGSLFRRLGRRPSELVEALDEALEGSGWREPGAGARVTISTATPTSDLGSRGDVWIQDLSDGGGAHRVTVYERGLSRWASEFSWLAGVPLAGAGGFSYRPGELARLDDGRIRMCRTGGIYNATQIGAADAEWVTLSDDFPAPPADWAAEGNTDNEMPAAKLPDPDDMSEAQTQGITADFLLVYDFGHSEWRRGSVGGWLLSALGGIATQTEATEGTESAVRQWSPRRIAQMIAALAPEGEDNVQSDWDEGDDTSDAFIQNKPTISESAGSNIVVPVRNGDRVVLRAVGVVPNVAGDDADQFIVVPHYIAENEDGYTINPAQARDYASWWNAFLEEVGGFNITDDIDHPANPISDDHRVPLGSAHFDNRNEYVPLPLFAGDIADRAVSEWAHVGNEDTIPTEKLPGLVSSHRGVASINLSDLSQSSNGLVLTMDADQITGGQSYLVLAELDTSVILTAVGSDQRLVTTLRVLSDTTSVVDDDAQEYGIVAGGNYRLNHAHFTTWTAPIPPVDLTLNLRWRTANSGAATASQVSAEKARLILIPLA